MLKLGLDFGTSNLVMSRIDPKTREPKIIPVGEFSTIPSIIYWNGKDECQIGRPVWELIRSTSAMPDQEKREVIKYIFPNIKEYLHENIKFQVIGKTAVEICAKMIAELKTIAEKGIFHQKISSICITYPAAFSETAISNLLKAAELAGFTDIEKRTEPLADILGYSMLEGYVDLGNGILVYDLGGGTFDLAFARRDRDGAFHFPIQGGIPKLGGDVFDNKLYELICSKADQKMERISIRERMQIRDMKHFLTENNSASYHLPNGQCISVTRAEFEEVIKPLVDQTIEKTKNIVKEVKDKKWTLSACLVVGGTSQIPLVRRALKELCRKEGLPKPLWQNEATFQAASLGALVDLNAIEKQKPKDEAKDEAKDEVKDEAKEKSEGITIGYESDSLDDDLIEIDCPPPQKTIRHILR